MPSVKLEDFKQNLKQLSRVNRFYVTISFNTYFDDDNSFLVKSTSIPQRIIGDIEIPWQGNKYHVSGDNSFSPLTITFYNNHPTDGKLSIRDRFEKWMDFINNDYYENGIRNPHAICKGTVNVELLNGKAETVKTYVYVDAQPTELSDIEYNMDSTDQISEFTVTFNYSYCDIGTIGVDNNLDQQAEQAIYKVKKTNIKDKQKLDTGTTLNTTA